MYIMIVLIVLYAVTNYSLNYANQAFLSFFVAQHICSVF